MKYQYKHIFNWKKNEKTSSFLWEALDNHLTVRLCLCGIILLTIVSCKSEKEEEPQTNIDEKTVILTNAQYKNAGIQTGKPEEITIGSTIKANGKIDVPPQNLISVSAPLGGYLNTTDLLPGMQVSKGQVIATMQDQRYIQLQQDYLTAKARLQYFQSDYDRQKTLNQSQASSEKIMQQALTEANSQRILLNSLGEQLKLININHSKLTMEGISNTICIYSPISGFVSKVNVNVGKYVSPSEVMFELIDPTDIHLNLRVFEKDLGKLYIGQEIMSYTNNAPDKKYPCKIILINKDVSVEGTIQVHCHFSKYNPLLIPGLYMNADIQIDNKKTNALPEDAIITYHSRQYVFTEIEKNKFEMQEVNIGGTKDGYTAVLNLDNLKDRNIVIKGAYALLMKLKNKEE